jgi:small acid-soluble spore protein F (minor alpha/beta-type SASP)
MFFVLNGGIFVSRHGIMSEQLKSELARELGVYNTVKNEGGWGSVTSRDCGNLVAKAIEFANRATIK